MINPLLPACTSAQRYKILTNLYGFEEGRKRKKGEKKCLSLFRTRERGLVSRQEADKQDYKGNKEGSRDWVVEPTSHHNTDGPLLGPKLLRTDGGVYTAQCFPHRWY